MQIRVSPQAKKCQTGYLPASVLQLDISLNPNIREKKIEFYTNSKLSSEPKSTVPQDNPTYRPFHVCMQILGLLMSGTGVGYFYNSDIMTLLEREYIFFFFSF